MSIQVRTAQTAARPTTVTPVREAMLITVPQNESAEVATIGAALMYQGENMHQVSWLEPDDFYIVRHRYLWQAMKSLLAKDIPVDLVTLREALSQAGVLKEIGGDPYLTGLLIDTPSSQHITHYAAMVKRAAIRRRGLETLDTCRKMLLDEQAIISETLSGIHGQVLDLMALMPNKSTVTAHEAVQSYRDLMAKEHSESQYIKTGYLDFDRLITGLYPGRIVTIGGETGMGKTWLMLNMAYQIASSGRKVAFFSTEMTVDELTDRLIWMLTGVTREMLESRTATPDQIKNVNKTLDEIGRLPLLFDHNENEALTPDYVRAQCTQLVGMGSVDVVFVDHIHDMQLSTVEASKYRGDKERVSRVMEVLKGLTKKLALRLVLGAQLRRIDDKQNRRPSKYDFRDSGRIEQLSFICAMLYRESVVNEECEFPNQGELIVDKVRQDGRVGVANVYISDTMRFLNSAVRHVDLGAL